MDIRNLCKARVLKALYNRAKCQGMGIFHFDPKPMTDEEAAAMLKRQTYFDYVKGRVLKVDLKGDYLETALYDRDNGYGAAEYAILDELTRPEKVA
jgi:hypothetical protein